MKHIVIHQDRQAGSIFFHECHMVWTIKRGTQGTIVTRIMTGSDPKVIYGTDEPEIRRRIDRLKRRRIDRGEHFAAGSLFSGAPRIGSRAERLQGEDVKIVGELYFAIAADPRFVVVPPEGRTHPTDSVQYRSVPCSTARWSDYLAAHRQKDAHRRNRRLKGLLEELLTFCEQFSPGAQRRRREQFLPLLTKRRMTKGEAERAYFASARSMALALGAEELGVSVRNLTRRIHLHTPSDYSFG